MRNRANGGITLDRLDRQIIHALILDGRCPFSRLAGVLGSSEQTVARRYRDLREAGVIRVRGLEGPSEATLDWFVRVQVRPGAADRLADALAARHDVSWVTITAGGTEVVCATRARTVEQREVLLLERLPRTSYVTSLTAHAILHRYAGTGKSEWAAFDDRLKAPQVDALLSHRPAPPPGMRANAPRHAEFVRLTSADAKLVAALHDDGRASYAALSAATGRQSGQVAHRLDALLSCGALYIDVEIAVDLLGFSTSALLWMTVAPSELAAAAERMAKAPETGFVAAVTGPANLHATVVCRDISHLYEFLRREVGALRAVQTVETSPIARRVKQARSIMQGVRLPDPV
jgi:DNA-binding Lrp family transcriptional regulator